MGNFRDEVQCLLNSSIRVTFQGKSIFNAGEVNEKTIDDNESCMRDFVVNDYGVLVQVNYDIVRDE